MNDPNLSKHNTVRSRLTAVSTKHYWVAQRPGCLRKDSKADLKHPIGSLSLTMSWKLIKLTGHPPKYHLPCSHFIRRWAVWNSMFSVHERTIQPQKRKWLMLGFRGPYGMLGTKPRLLMCKGSTLLAVLSLLPANPISLFCLLSLQKNDPKLN